MTGTYEPLELEEEKAGIEKYYGVGFALLFISWYSLGWFIQYLVISYLMIRSEEEFLNLRYGEEYEKYCKKVPRYFHYK